MPEEKLQKGQLDEVVLEVVEILKKELPNHADELEKIEVTLRNRAEVFERWRNRANWQERQPKS